MLKRKIEKRIRAQSIRRRAFALLGLILFCSAAVRALNSPITEYEVKAAYIYNFAKFIDWPANVLPNNNSAIVIGVIGSSEFTSTLTSAVKGKSILNHPIMVRSVKWPLDSHPCHILFISSYEQPRAKEITSALQSTPVLSITETEKTSRAKGIINLLVDNGKVRFEIDASQAEKNGLKISSKLLRLAVGSSE
jgi:hypothetical protein